MENIKRFQKDLEDIADNTKNKSESDITLMIEVAIFRNINYSYNIKSIKDVDKVILDFVSRRKFEAAYTLQNGHHDILSEMDCTHEELMAELYPDN